MLRFSGQKWECPDQHDPGTPFLSENTCSGLKAGDVVYYTEREKFDPWGFGSFGSGWDASYDYGEYPGTADVGSPEWRQYSGQGYDVSVG